MFTPAPNPKHLSDQLQSTERHDFDVISKNESYTKYIFVQTCSAVAYKLSIAHNHDYDDDDDDVPCVHAVNVIILVSHPSLPTPGTQKCRAVVGTEDDSPVFSNVFHYSFTVCK